MRPILGWLLVLSLCGPAAALDRPWISTVFFYWYTWDYDKELGSWMAGIHNTPLDGYYDSRTFRDNRRSLWQASEWGVTHQFMDYWSPHWKGEGGEMREAIVMRAAESLRKEGYDVWMGYYQDGDNFEMQEFSRNVSEKRDVHQWLRDFAKSEVWPKIDGEPFQLVYARNGRPKTTIDHIGFREFLRTRYGRIVALNRTWGTGFRSFDGIEMSFGAKGHQRAESIEYQYEIWRREWDKLNGLVRKEFGLPGMRASFDVGYKPYLSFRFANFARVLGGPHSYAGIFGPPHDQDAQRFIQAAVAKKYGTPFLDHFKNYYHDWDIRVPGFAFLPDPYNFDRFWVGSLARHSEALLHLSWNEWWEGSNLEPCYEFGKTYCEKNLFYATLMKLTFDSIRKAGRGAPVAVLLNDWRLMSGGQHIDELYGVIQILRRLNVPFDLLPDDMVTANALKSFRLVVAPTFGCGLGYNSKRARIADVLADWLKRDDRRLIVSDHDSLARMFGLREIQRTTPAAAETGRDLNVFVDVGVEGDTEFLTSGCSHRENWGRLPEGAFGADSNLTVRWTPAAGDETALLLPASPNRDHIIRLAGRAIWANEVTVIVNGRAATTMAIKAGAVDASARVPAAAIGASPMVRLVLRYSKTHVPMKEAPKRYPTEARTCNVAIDYVQWSTANVPARTTKQQYTMPKESVRLSSDLFGRAKGESLTTAFALRRCLTGAGTETLAELAIGRVPRDLSLRFGASKVLYVNGLLSEVVAPEYWLPVLRDWAGVDFHRFAVGEHYVATRLAAGDTQFVVCFNEDIARPRELRLSIPPQDLPLSEVLALSRDGKAYEALPCELVVRDTLRYYGAYQFAFAPVRIETPRLVLQPGESKTFPVNVSNLTGEPVSGTIQAASIIPTLAGKPVTVSLAPRATKSVMVPITAAATSDWGRKTVYFELKFSGRRAVVLRELIVQKPTQVRLTSAIVDADQPEITLAVPSNPYGETAALTGQLTCNGRTVELPVVSEGTQAQVPLPASSVPSADRPQLLPRKLRITPPTPGRERPDLEVFLAVKPTSYTGPSDAQTALVVFNACEEPLDHELLEARVPNVPSPCCVRTEGGVPVPSQTDGSRVVRFLAVVPGRSARTFYLCKSPAAVKTDLVCSSESLGSGKGILKIGNSHLSVTLSEAAGGTVTSLRSLKTGRDYGRNTFGVNYGQFSQHDPAVPRTNTVLYIHEKKVRQEGSPGRIELLSHGPAVVIARVTWADGKVQVEQTYEIRAYQPFFVIRQKVRPVDLKDVQELVALNAQFRPHRLNKTYPNFVGMVNDKEQPHFGWRYGAWVPDYATLMARGNFDESISLVLTRKKGLTEIRQGFWPKHRPKSGKCEVAQVELLADTTTGCEAEIYVLLHGRHQIVAKQFLADRRNAPAVHVVANPRWARRTTPRDAPSNGWYSSFWRHRVPVALPADRTKLADAHVVGDIDLAGIVGKPVDPRSVRVISRDALATSREIPSTLSDDGQTVQWKMPTSGIEPSASLHVYFDTLARGPKPRSWLTLEAQTPAIANETFDGSRRGWQCSGCAFEAKQGRGESTAVRLETTQGRNLSLLSYHLITPSPDSTYVLQFYAKTQTPGAEVRTNFYADAKYDFPQVPVRLRADGKWHRYSTKSRTGQFPPTVRPHFRVWLIGKPAYVAIDDLSLRPTAPEPVMPVVKFGEVETYP